MLVHCIYAVRDVEPLQRDVAAVFRLPRLTRWRLLILPSILPLTIVGVRLSATIALLLSVAAELIGTAPGIGAQISAAQLTGDIERTYAYVICAGLLGVLLNALMRLLERYVISWHPSVRRARELS
jgi:ABC-type nitrate/sulfonate/bicarbonate transport system permease component